jgi:DNA-binding NarL/FixJ family response regulator
MEEKSESLADKTLDEKATQKPEPKLEAASLLGKIFTLMRKKREQDIKYSQQEQLQQSQAQIKELETRMKILEAIKGPKDDGEDKDKKPGEKPKAKKILEYLGKGWTLREIAKQVDASTKTVMKVKSTATKLQMI